MSKIKRNARLLAAAIGGAVLTAAAEDSPAGAPRSLPTSAVLSLERVRLPHGEGLGLLGVGYLGELAPGWWVGPTLYGAASGRRGGLFTWGGELQYRWRVGPRWSAAAGLYVGGGGGAAAPVGGGLMLRPHADLLVDLGGWQLGIGAAQVHFPSGEFRSTQLGLVLRVDDRYAFRPPRGFSGNAGAESGRPGPVDAAGDAAVLPPGGWLRLDSVHPYAGRYHARHDGDEPLRYVGARFEQQLTPRLAATLEAAGAAQGGADGYMEVLAGLAAQWPLADGRLRVGGRASLGLAGGGAVPTGGGRVAKAGLTGRLLLGDGWSIELEGGRARSLGGDFDARYAQLSLGLALRDAARPSGPRAAASPPAASETEWGLGVLHYVDAARKSGPARPMSLVGLRFNRALDERYYLSGQAHSAAAGGAGAYSAGLVGLGARLPLGPAWQAGAEALVGAAGGGGVAVRGGAVGQPMVWVGRALGPYGRVQLRAGWIKAWRGELSSPVAELGWSLQFGAP